MGFTNRNRSSAKIVAAKRRAEKEQGFLDSLSVRCDDPDTVLDDNGQVLPIKAVYKIPGVTLVKGNAKVTIEMVDESLRVISECFAAIKRLSGR